MTTNFTPQDWYWVVGGDAANVYSSARLMLVPTSDATYQAWLTAKAPAQALPMASMRDLETYMATAYPPGTLKSYNAFARNSARNRGVVVTSLSAVPFFSDAPSVNDINASYNYAEANPAATFQWKLTDGTFVALDATKITKLHNDALAFVQTCFTQEDTTRAAIDGGTVTTLAQIDAAFAAISNVYP